MKIGDEVFIHVCKMDGKKDRELYDVMFKDGTIWSLEPEQIKKEIG